MTTFGAAHEAPRSLYVPDGPYASFPYTYKGHVGQDEGYPFRVKSVEWSPDGRRIASAGERYGGVHVWDAADGGNVIILKAQAPMAWSPDGKYLACASAEGCQNVVIWNAADNFVTFIYRGHTDREDYLYTMDSMAWSSDCRRIASSYSRVVHVWDASDGGNVVIYRGHANTVNAIAWSPDGAYIASASSDATVQIWNAVNGSNVCTYYRHSMNRVNGVAWSPDGTRIASSSDTSGENRVQVWNASDGGYVGSLSPNTPATWSSDGTQIISGDVQTWNAASRSVVTLSQSVPVAWSPNGTQIVSLYWGIQIWNAMNGSNVAIQNPPNAALAVAWSPDGIRIATSPSDPGAVQVLSAPVLVLHPPIEEAPRSRFWLDRIKMWFYSK